MRVIWGPAPGSESAREPSAEQKIAALEQYVHDKGPLERDGGPPLLDLRELASAANTAGKSATSAGSYVAAARKRRRAAWLLRVGWASSWRTTIISAGASMPSRTALPLNADDR